MNIGEVLGLLRPEFPDVTLSKIRFLEEQGLVEPDRTPAGYRKFSHTDVERLRYVLSVQRDQYLPLRVIREHLDALDEGRQTVPLAGSSRMPRIVSEARPVVPERFFAAPDVRITRQELLEVSGIDDDLLTNLESYGLITPHRGEHRYSTEAICVARAVRDLTVFGIEPRHLRPLRTAADREAGLVEQVIAPLRRQRGPRSAAGAQEAGREVAALLVRLHASLVASALDRDVL
jgi:DNA-binding transcriptional MerR regulator